MPVRVDYGRVSQGKDQDAPEGAKKVSSRAKAFDAKRVPPDTNLRAGDEPGGLSRAQRPGQVRGGDDRTSDSELARVAHGASTNGAPSISVSGDVP
jgi:hypothetical protein